MVFWDDWNEDSDLTAPTTGIMHRIFGRTHWMRRADYLDNEYIKLQLDLWIEFTEPVEIGVRYEIYYCWITSLVSREEKCLNWALERKDETTYEIIFHNWVYGSSDRPSSGGRGFATDQSMITQANSYKAADVHQWIIFTFLYQVGDFINTLPGLIQLNREAEYVDYESEGGARNFTTSAFFTLIKPEDMEYLENCGMDFYDGSGGTYYATTDPETDETTYHHAHDYSDLRWIPKEDRNMTYDCTSIAANYPETNLDDAAVSNLVQTFVISLFLPLLLLQF